MTDERTGRRTALGLHLGEVIRAPETKGKSLRVTETDLDSLPRIHCYLVEVAKRRGTITYTEVKSDLDLPHPPNGLGRVLDLLSVACLQRLDEPSLAALVVSTDTGEVGAEFASGDPAAERESAYRRRAVR